MNETIIILRERFKSLEEASDLGDEDFAYALFDYCGFICSSAELSKVIKEMAKEGDVDAHTFHWLFIFGGLRNTVRNFKTGKMQKGQSGIPLFFDKEIEEKYGVAQALGKILYMSKKKRTRNPDTVNIYEIVSDETGKFLVDEDFPPKELIRKFRLFQNDLMSRLVERPKQNIYFDPQKSELVLGNKKVPFRKHTEQYHTLRIIFENDKEIGKEWFFSELAELIDPAKGYTNKNFHNYISAIKRRVSSDMGLKDLFITTNQSVRINRDYLKSK